MSALVIGFTGTRNGMTAHQVLATRCLLASIVLGGVDAVALHGDCVGADADFDEMAEQLQLPRRCRPCTFADLRARTDAEQVAEPVRPMERNRAIVADATVMIACPPNETPIKSGSGTWATIKFARLAGRPLAIVYPSGRVEMDEAFARFVNEEPPPSAVEAPR